MRPILALFAALLITVQLVAAEVEPVAWTVLQVPAADGGMAFELVGLSRADPQAPEIKERRKAADDAYAAAKAAWEERRKAFEAVKENSSKSFRKVEAEPLKPQLKFLGQPLKEKYKAEELLAKLRNEALAKADPGLARRKRVMTEKLLPYFTIGMQASADWLIETRDKHGDRFACLAGYLSHATGDDGQEPWFFKYGGLKAKFEDCKRAGVICWSTWYGLAEAAPAHYQPTPAAATPVNAKVQGTMIAYWTNAKRFMQMAAEYPDVDSVLQIEPDEWGHLLLSCGFDYRKEGVILVGGSGLPELKGLPDTVQGWAQGFRTLRDTYAPHVLLAANPSAWDRNGSMSGQKWAEYFTGMGVTPTQGWDLFITQLHDWDRGQPRNGANAKYPPYTEADTVTYHGSVDRWCEWVKAIHDGTGMWGVAWQLPQGNWTYAACDGSEGHGMDNVTELLLEGYPRNQTAAKMAAAGCCMWIFSLGGAGASVDDNKKDGVTNPSPHAGNRGLKSEFADDDGGYLRLRSAEYFKNPVPIQGKPIPQGKAKAKPEKPAEDKPAVAAEPRPTLADPKERTAYAERLRTVALAEIAARREPQFEFAAFKSKATLRQIDGDGTMTLAIAGTGEMTAPWAKMSDEDLARLALVIQRNDDQERRALAGFFLLLTGERSAAQEHLMKAGAKGAAVEAAFGLTPAPSAP